MKVDCDTLDKCCQHQIETKNKYKNRVNKPTIKENPQLEKKKQEKKPLTDGSNG